jgi:hypothetical protein
MPTKVEELRKIIEDMGKSTSSSDFSRFNDLFSKLTKEQTKELSPQELVNAYRYSASFVAKFPGINSGPIFYSTIEPHFPNDYSKRNNGNLSSDYLVNKHLTKNQISALLKAIGNHNTTSKTFASNLRQMLLDLRQQNISKTTPAAISPDEKISESSYHSPAGTINTQRPNTDPGRNKRHQQKTTHSNRPASANAQSSATSSLYPRKFLGTPSDKISHRRRAIINLGNYKIGTFQDNVAEVLDNQDSSSEISDDSGKFYIGTPISPFGEETSSTTTFIHRSPSQFTQISVEARQNNDSQDLPLDRANVNLLAGNNGSLLDHQERNRKGRSSQHDSQESSETGRITNARKVLDGWIDAVGKKDNIIQYGEKLNAVIAYIVEKLSGVMMEEQDSQVLSDQIKDSTRDSVFSPLRYNSSENPRRILPDKRFLSDFLIDVIDYVEKNTEKSEVKDFLIAIGLLQKQEGEKKSEIPSPTTPTKRSVSFATDSPKQNHLDSMSVMTIDSQVSGDYSPPVSTFYLNEELHNIGDNDEYDQIAQELVTLRKELEDERYKTRELQNGLITSQTTQGFLRSQLQIFKAAKIDAEEEARRAKEEARRAKEEARRAAEEEARKKVLSVTEASVQTDATSTESAANTGINPPPQTSLVSRNLKSAQSFAATTTLKEGADAENDDSEIEEPSKITEEEKKELNAINRFQAMIAQRTGSGYARTIKDLQASYSKLAQCKFKEKVIEILSGTTITNPQKMSWLAVLNDDFSKMKITVKSLENYSSLNHSKESRDIRNAMDAAAKSFLANKAILAKALGSDLQNNQQSSSSTSGVVAAAKAVNFAQRLRGKTNHSTTNSGAAIS